MKREQDQPGTAKLLRLHAASGVTRRRVNRVTMSNSGNRDPSRTVETHFEAHLRAFEVVESANTAASLTYDEALAGLCSVPQNWRGPWLQAASPGGWHCFASLQIKAWTK